jgi:tetratricopeptide (TPR) repeat protein
VYRLDRVLRAWWGMDDADPRDRNARESLRLAEEVVGRFPDDKAALQSAAAVLGEIGKQDRAMAVLRRVLELDPGYFSAALELVALLPERNPEALAVARRAVAARRSPANLAVLAKVLLAAGGDAEALEAAREALRSGAGESLVTAQACFVLAQRDVAECTPVWGRLLSEGANEYERDRARTGLVQALAAQGRIREARRLALSVEEARRGNPLELLFIFDIGRSRTDAPEALAVAYRLKSGWVRRANLAFYGDMEGAERASASLAGGEGYALADTGYRPYLLAHQGRLAEAVEAFRANRDAEEKSGEYQNLYNNAYLIAEALLAAGRPAEALEVEVGSVACGCFDPVERAGGYPRLALVRTRALEALGRRDDAVRQLDQLIAFFATADADLPLVVEARAMRARLAGR